MATYAPIDIPTGPCCPEFRPTTGIARLHHKISDSEQVTQSQREYTKVQSAQPLLLVPNYVGRSTTAYRTLFAAGQSSWQAGKTGENRRGKLLVRSSRCWKVSGTMNLRRFRVRHTAERTSMLPNPLDGVRMNNFV